MSLDYFATPGVIDAAKEVLTRALEAIVKEFPSHDVKAIEAFVKAQFLTLLHSNNPVTADQIVSDYRQSNG